MKIRLTILLVSSICCIAIFTSCDPEKPEAVVCGSQDLTNIPYVPEEYVLNVPDGFPPVVPTPGNPLTKDGVTLGRFLFYDPILSGDSTQSCSSCHAPQHAFSDPFPVSVGIDGIPGKRNAMALMNLAMHFNGFVWDGSSETLEEQALEPVNNTLELHGDWAEIEVKLRSHPSYPARFRKAFGISTTAEIDRELVAMALAQFQRILISSGDSKHDRFIRGEYTHTPSEERGFRMFFDGDSVLPEAECGHCHSLGLFTTNEYMNNGLDSANDLTQFPDPGRGAITNVIFDNGRFKVPTIIYCTLYA